MDIAEQEHINILIRMDYAIQKQFQGKEFFLKLYNRQKKIRKKQFRSFQAI